MNFNWTIYYLFKNTKLVAFTCFLIKIIGKIKELALSADHILFCINYYISTDDNQCYNSDTYLTLKNIPIYWLNSKNNLRKHERNRRNWIKKVNRIAMIWESYKTNQRLVFHEIQQILSDKWLTLGMVSLLQTLSARSLSLISQANTEGHSRLYCVIWRTTSEVATRGLLPPIARGFIDPVS